MGFIDIKEYSYILAVVECGSVSRAAERLYISQPSLSAYLINLEKRLGITFFVEGSGKTQLTAEGKLYIDYARQIMTLNNNLQHQLEDHKNMKSGLVRMGIAHTRATFILPKLMAVILEKHPDIQLDIHEANSRELEESLAMREVDFAILNSPTHSQGMNQIELGQEEFVMVVHRDHSLCQKAIHTESSTYPWIDIREAANEPFVLLRRGQRLRQIAEMLFTQAGIQPPVLCETRSNITTYRMTEMGLGCSFSLDTFFYANYKGPSDTTRLLSVGTPPITTKLAAVHRAGQELSKAARAIITSIQEVL